MTYFLFRFVNLGNCLVLTPTCISALTKSACSFQVTATILKPAFKYCLNAKNRLLALFFV